MSERRSRYGFYLPNFRVISRLVLAIGGSYGLAVLTDLMFLALPIDHILPLRQFAWQHIGNETLYLPATK